MYKRINNNLKTISMKKLVMVVVIAMLVGCTSSMDNMDETCICKDQFNVVYSNDCFDQGHEYKTKEPMDTAEGEYPVYKMIIHVIDCTQQ